ncbi:Fbox domain containing protein [Acanthamoeba castellanii str. Neff]|uniref:Fbox domain containing protein n=1 Tax=Acanthamoeba castellanii (strain ATCC 30010 / Neff) TaxID=1257118 RepID=L8H2S2_ACACF|nr:Fbox domain containing protein [Acanthamoeba castellanii str. Neff]ELR18681.1 Fbox domain containing protein [Acanthamoeba castellanii str. Neff]
MDNLPEEIGLHILSFLTPKEVVSSAVVSQRWRQLSADNHGHDLDWRGQFQQSRQTEANWESGTFRHSAFHPYGFTAYKKTVGGMLFQSDEDRLVAGHFNTGDVVVFENPTEACPRPKQLHLLEYEDRYQPLPFPQPQPHFACGHTDGVVNVWNLAGGEHVVALIRSFEWVESLQFNRAAKQLAVGYSTGKIGLWDIEQASVVGLLKGHKANVMCMQLSPDGRVAFTGSLDSSIRIWYTRKGGDMRTAATVSCIKGERVVKCLSVDFDSHRLVHNRGDQGLSLLDIRMTLSSAGPEGGDTLVHAPPVVTSWKAHSGAVLRVQMQGDRIVTGARDKTAKVWDLRSPAEPRAVLTLPHEDWVTSLQFDEETLRCAWGADISTYFFRSAEA